MNWKAIWIVLRTNPVVVGVWTAFAGALGSAVETALDNHAVWTLQSAEHMLGSAAFIAAIALVHLYAPVPGSNAANPQIAAKPQ